MDENPHGFIENFRFDCRFAKKLVKYFLTEVILVAYAGLLNEVIHGSCFHGRSPFSRFEGTRF